MTAMERLLLRLPEAEEAVLEGFWADAGKAICAYTRRNEVPAQLLGTQTELAILYYNRQGIEGESAHSEGGVSRTMEAMPAGILAQIRPYRAAMAGEIRSDRTARNDG